MEDTAVKRTAAAAPVPVDRLRVAFSGEGSGVEELAWGQWEIWLAMISQNSSLPLGGIKPLEPGTTVQDIAEELRYLMSRYQSMRTRLKFDANGRPVQELFGSGEIDVEIFEAGGAEPGDVAAAVNADWGSRVFDYANEWPVRMGVVNKDGAAAYMVVIVCHLAMDGAGAQVMIREVTSRQSGPIAGMQPMEQARWQRSPAGRRQDAAAQRYWDRTLRALPAQPIACSTDPRSPRYWSGQLRSRALLLALRATAQRTATNSSAILLALYAIAVGKVAGTNPVAIRGVVGNRFRPGLDGVVCPASQTGLCVLDVADITVDEAVERARRGSVLAYKHCYRSPEQLPALIDRVNRERATDLDIERYFNDRRAESAAEQQGEPISPELLSAALADSDFQWTFRRDAPFERLFLHIDVAPDGLALLVEADTHHYGPAQIEALAWTVEATAVRAAFDPAVPTGVSGVRSDG